MNETINLLENENFYIYIPYSTTSIFKIHFVEQNKTIEWACIKND
jgi:hypothetical protein